jgi:hypothetical protein
LRRHVFLKGGSPSRRSFFVLCDDLN